MYKCIKYFLMIVACTCFCVFANAQNDTLVREDFFTVPAPVDTVKTVEESPSFYEPPKNDFKEITSIPKVEERKLDERKVNEIKKEDAYWYANETPQKKIIKKRSQSLAWVTPLFWLLAIFGFLALLVWILASANIFLFRRKAEAVDDTVEEEHFISENIFDIEYEKEIQKAVAAQNFRLAVRLLYLQSLKELSLRNLIQFTPEKTNSQYLFQLAGSSFYKNFFTLTRNFNYIWYGKFPLSADGYSILQKDFSNFKQQLQ